MKELLQACLNTEPLTTTPYTPAIDKLALQLTFKKGVIVDIHQQAKDSYIVKVMAAPAEPQGRPVLKAFFISEDPICGEIIEKHFSTDDQDLNCKTMASFISGKHLKLNDSN